MQAFSLEVLTTYFWLLASDKGVGVGFSLR